MRVQDVHADSKGRINLGSAYAEQRFIIIEEDNRIILERAVIVPKREIWLHKNKKAKRAVEKGIEEAKKGKLRKKVIKFEK